MPDQLVFLLILGLVAGVMSGLFGIGGGAIIVPMLVIFLGFTQISAIATSLAALLLPVGIFAVLEYRRKGQLRLLPATAVALGLLTSSWFGADIAIGLEPDVLRQAYGVFLIYMAWRYIAPRQLWAAYQRAQRGEDDANNAAQTPEERDETPPETRSQAQVFAISLGIGLVAGVFSGLFGIGGGVVIVPAVMLILRYDQILANGVSLGALLLPVGLPGVLRYWEAGVIDLLSAAPLALGLLLGAFFGARLALNLPRKTVRRLYGVFLLLVGLRFLFNL